MAHQYGGVGSAARLANIRARWEGGEQTALLRGALADWQAIADAQKHADIVS